MPRCHDYNYLSYSKAWRCWFYIWMFLTALPWLYFSVKQVLNTTLIHFYWNGIWMSKNIHFHTNLRWLDWWWLVRVIKQSEKQKHTYDTQNVMHVITTITCRNPRGEPLTVCDHFPRWVQSEEFHFSLWTWSNIWNVSAVQTNSILPFHFKTSTFIFFSTITSSDPGWDEWSVVWLWFTKPSSLYQNTSDAS